MLTQTLKKSPKDQLPNISKKVWWYVSFPTSSRSLCFPPALMHFCELTARVSFPMSLAGSTVPWKIGLNCRGRERERVCVCVWQMSSGHARTQARTLQYPRMKLESDNSPRNDKQVRTSYGVNKSPVDHGLILIHCPPHNMLSYWVSGKQALADHFHFTHTSTCNQPKTIYTQRAQNWQQLTKRICFWRLVCAIWIL